MSHRFYSKVLTDLFFMSIRVALRDPSRDGGSAGLMLYKQWVRGSPCFKALTLYIISRHRTGGETDSAREGGPGPGPPSGRVEKPGVRDGEPGPRSRSAAPCALENIAIKAVPGKAAMVCGNE